ncbi:hypothetical protein OOZ63_06205 [Paucibacter sp. PLA-PC-4]|uniref:hypothetical protein n=1 Tax=Paucibacter sp. PLA-PC-4 TaxID=2993655 RepID=UPI002248E9D9|nr:hypothetical protein [Paucibacter sp. PLA-PC-4]MCX2861428.1 hypothetical protein [Paucibacter sp. PLA-PC-4]
MQRWSRLLGLCSLACCAAFAQTKPVPGLHQPRSAATASPAAAPVKRSAAPMAATIESGRVCTTIDFEGVGNLAAVPPVAGITTPGWLGIIDFDAGGTGNFANEPSPQTIAFWLGGNASQRDIVLANPASKAEFYFSSFVNVRVTAFDEAGVELTSALGLPNYNTGTGDPNGSFNRWDPIKVEVEGNKIKTVRVTGNTDQTGIDNLKICTTIGIEAVEVTQAIQQYQSIKDLKASLQAGREAPVPVIAGKPAVVRVYMNKVDNVTPVTVKLSGAVNQTRQLVLQPQCGAEDQRRQRNGCQSLDFYFSPPEGDWDLNAKVLDSAGNVLESHDLPFKSRKTDALVLKAVSICEAKDAAGNWLCAAANTLAGNIGVLRKLAPTSSVTVQVTNSFVRRDVATFPSVDNWWPVAIKDVNDLYGLFDGIGDLFGTHTVYYGMIRPALPGGTGGMAHEIPGRGAGSRTSAIRLGTETVTEVVAHEVGHTLGLRHTNTDVPVAGAAPPGCYNKAVDGATDWPFANNRIQSAARLEVGFDVATRKPLDPDNTYDILSYCVPRWISPQRYKTAIAALSGGVVTSASVTPSRARSTMTNTAIRSPLQAVGGYWTISGTLMAAGVQFDALFEDVASGPAGAGTGSHRVEVQSAAGATLALRRFTPTRSHSEGLGPDIEGPASFFALLPITAGAARIVVFDAANLPIGSLDLGGDKPVVTIVQPGGGVLSGPQRIEWTVSDADSTGHTAKVYYSPNNGTVWSQIAAVSDSASLTVDFDLLPGAQGTGRLMVSVSDGINSGSALSEPFSVPRKGPSALSIVSPLANQAFPPGVPVTLEGLAYDVDDGMLDGGAVSWQSNIGGPLGNGALLTTDKLAKGSHILTMTATDRDGNAATATTTVHIAGAAPSLNLNVSGLDQLPTTCVEATIDPKIETGSVALKSVEYSLDGGLQWTAIPLNRLPFKLLVPGSGFIHLVVRAYDIAGQSAAKDAKFFINSACDQGGPPRLAGTVVAQGFAATGIYFIDVQLSNSGLGLAQAIQIKAVRPRTLSGSGTVSYNGALSPALPITVPDLTMGQSSIVRLHFNVPASVTRFSVVEDGVMTDKFGRVLNFSISQSVIPK